MLNAIRIGAAIRESRFLRIVYGVGDVFATESTGVSRFTSMKASLLFCDAIFELAQGETEDVTVKLVLLIDKLAQTWRHMQNKIDW